ncbi:helicase-associated domain-containing protein [Stackebrandtia soli]|uniref:helicase-associated domain-containing protein n=1 Tax=Stackebrandtia soli TaxID=1892856 RepID=UPI0039E945FD
MAARSFSSATSGSLAATLRSWTNEALAELAERRTDLVVPAPVGFDELADRARTVLSVTRALDLLDAFTLRVLDGLRLIAVNGVADVGRLATITPDRSGVDAAVARMRALALVWGPDEALRYPSSVAEAAGPYPAGLGRDAAELSEESARLVADPAALRRAVMAAPPQARTVLDRLAEGPPIGTVAGAYEREPETPVRWLIARGLLVPVDDDTVELPGEVGRLLRRDDGPLGRLPRQPEPDGTRRLSPGDVDPHAAAQVIEAVRLTEELLTTLAVEPVTSVKAGGMGMQGLQRIVKTVGVTLAQAATLLEAAYAAGLLGSPGAWLPSLAFDAWRSKTVEERWTRLARAWLDAPRDARLVGNRTASGRGATVLGPDLTSLSAPRYRRRALGLLAEYAPGTPVPEDTAVAILAWRTPRRHTEDGVRAALAQASLLGITARDALSTFGRRLLDAGADDPLGVRADEPDPVEEALRDVLPPATEELIVQSDLTVIVPGHPSPLLTSELAVLADAESPTTYRVSPDSLRRAMDAGYSSEDITGVFTRRSLTPLPQALTYLIADVWRRHGGLRVGEVGSYLRGDDTAALTAILADRRLAPARLRRLSDTVLVSPLSMTEVMTLLRRGGHAPVAEDATGAIIADRTETPRAPTASRPEVPADPTPRLHGAPLHAIIDQLRTGDERAEPAPPRPADDLVELLRQALPKRRLVWVEYEAKHGEMVRKLLRPVSIGSGYLRAEDKRTDMLHTIALHTIRSVTIASV